MRILASTALPAGTVPTGSYELGPAASGKVVRANEPEVFVVVRGVAMVEVASRLVRVGDGSAFLAEAMESHVVHNDSPDTTLVVLTTRSMAVGSLAAA
jgi:mannose-6-phosphate isomerase-like protein (cupin superfamily)